MRSLLLALAALAFATAAGSTPGPVTGHYYLDANGKCRANGGPAVPANMCSVATAHPSCKQGVTKPCGKHCIPVGEICHTS